MEFRSVADLNRTILDKLDLLPHDIDVVVGIPRSGMLPATLVSLHLNVPLAELDGFLAGRLLEAGVTRRHAGLNPDLSTPLHALLVDDSVLSGQSLVLAQKKVADSATIHRFTSCIVYANPEFHGDAIVLERIRGARVFEWNVMNHSIISSSCVDIDGILCADPSPAENDDGDRYRSFIATARRRHTPRKRIGWLVTSRLEKYRTATEQWLAEAGIQYDHLIMLDLPDAETRRKLNAHAEHKGRFYRSCDARLFIESEPDQAQEIANISGKPALSLVGPVLCLPKTLSARSAGQGSIRLIKRWTPMHTKQFVKRLMAKL